MSADTHGTGLPEPEPEPAPAPDAGAGQFTCGQCHAQFCSRNELFTHLDAADHFVDGIASATIGPASASLCVSLRLSVRLSVSLSHCARLCAGVATKAQGNSALRGYYARQLRETAARQRDPSLWERNYALLSVPLPHTFRGSASSCLLPYVLEQLQAQPSTELLPLAFDTSDAVAWRLAARDADTAKVIAAAQDLGTLHRQEVCSMLPPLVLDVRPEHTVLDLCAAPGSKTLQLLDIMNLQADLATERHRETQRDTERQEVEAAALSGVRGLLVANDVSRDRAMTIAQRSRRGSSRTALALLCTDARRFPALYRRAYRIKYDRVLCDVPCSGDGTLRKSASMWSRWSVKDGLSIHLLQLAILKRGLELLADGGRLVYSTCSLNPIEGEAVVAAAIRHFDGAVRLLEIDRERWLRVVENGCEGLTCWEVPSPDYVGASERQGNLDLMQESDEADAAADSAMWLRYDDVPPEFRRSGGAGDSQKPDSGKKKRKGVSLCPTMFPPTGQPDVSPLDGAAAAAAEELRKCVRVLPTQGDGGGFFIALLERSRRTGSQQRGADKAVPDTPEHRSEEPSTLPDSAHSPDTPVQPVPSPTRERAPVGGRGGTKDDWGEAGRTPRAFLFDAATPELAASFTEWWGVNSPVGEALANALRVDRVSGRLLLPSPELSLLKVSKRHLRQRLVVEAGLCLCAQPTIAAPAASDSEAEEEEALARRWNLFDEAAEYVSRIATRRVLHCSRSGFAQLLRHGRLSREAVAAGECVTRASFSTCCAPERSLSQAAETLDQVVPGGVVLCFDFRRGGEDADRDSHGGTMVSHGGRMAAVSGRLHADGVDCLANDRTKHALLCIMGAAVDDA